MTGDEDINNRIYERLYEDDMDPYHTHWAELYLVRLPNNMPIERSVGERLIAQAWIAVFDDGYCELHNWHWFGKRDPQRPYHLSDPEDLKLYDAEQEVWQWLAEWELVELKPIGPEDSEYFATPKLLQKHNQAECWCGIDHSRE